MAAERDYHDIPGTYVQDGAHYRAGFHLNMFCMSLNQPDNRAAFRANEAGYLDGYKLTPAQRDAVLHRDWLALLRLGGNIFYTFKLAMFDGVNMQALGAAMDGTLTEAEFRQMMLDGGRPVDGNRSKGSLPMAEFVGGLATSHTPSLGAAFDKSLGADAYWKPLFDGLEPAREWLRKIAPDVCIVIYNDHACAFSLECIPTFAMGVASEFPIADEGYGPRPVPPVQGDEIFAWHLVESLIHDEFDLTIVNQIPVDHGLTVPLSVAFGAPDAWPCRVIPLCVNVIQYPPPSGKRCLDLGRALRRAIDAYPQDMRVAVFGTGGMSHQIQGERAGLINAAFDAEFMDRLVREPDELAKMSHTEYMREAGSEGLELVMWLTLRGAMSREVREAYRFYHVPASNTAYGLLALEDADTGQADA